MHCYMYQYILLSSSILLNGCHNLPNHLSVDRHLSCLWFGAHMKKTARMNLLVDTESDFYWINTFIIKFWELLLWTQNPLSKMFFKCFLPNWSLHFHFPNSSFEEQIILNFDEVQFINFFYKLCFKYCI